MTVRKIGRRWMLLGSVGALAIPALPSLLTRPFHAHAQDMPRPKRMVALMSQHGGVWQKDMFPNAALADTRFDHPVAGISDAHRGALRSELVDGERVVSQVLRASSSMLTPALVDKMNVIRGLDVPFYYGHARHVLGNYGDMSNNHDQTPLEQETADQVMAHSSVMYPTPPRYRHMNFSFEAMSVVRTDRGSLDGPVRAAEEVGVRTVYDAVFVPDEMGPLPTRPSPLSDVNESFRRLRSGVFGAGSRLGTADRRRLEAYMDLLSQIDQAQDADVAVACAEAPVPGDLRASSRYRSSTYQTINDVIVAAFMCDSSRVCAIRSNFAWNPATDMSSGGYHESAHAANGTGNAANLNRLSQVMRNENKSMFQEPILDLVTKLDSVSEGGSTILDNSLVWWAHEAGASTHNGDSIPVVSFGSAGGAMQTGQYLDLRDRGALIGGGFSAEGRGPGACFFQWTTTYLDAFGVPRSEWQRESRRAFSPMIPAPRWLPVQGNHAAMDASCDNPLPILT